MAYKNVFQKRFLTIFNRLGLNTKSKYLLALSGGLDSVVLFHLLKSSEVEFEVAHCNFKLRGKESDGDAVFVQNLCAKEGIICHLNSFETEAFASQKSISIEMAARELRYEWFYELLSIKHIKCLLTAHHGNDHIETAILNLTKGTGLAGLRGISNSTPEVKRPLLEFSKTELKDYAIREGLKWREDASNESNDFQRNRIRNELIPILQKVNPNLVHTYSNTAWRIGLWEAISNQELNDFKVKYGLSNSTYELPIDGLNQDLTKAVLVDLLMEKDFSINEIREFIVSKVRKTGSVIRSKSHELWIERDHIRIQPIVSNELIELELGGQGDFEINGVSIFLKSVEEKPHFDNHEIAYFFQENIKFPLTLRTWQEGDRMQPFGMRGTKLISDILIDSKVPNYLKPKQMVLLSKGEIIWLVGLKTSEKYRFSLAEKALLKIIIRS